MLRVINKNKKYSSPFLVSFLLMGLLLCAFHPYYVSVTEIKSDPKKKTLEISSRMFTNDLEDALRKLSKKQVDLLHPKDKKETDRLVADYLQKHLEVKVNGKAITYNFLGYEKEEESVWCYMEAANVPAVTKIEVENAILYDFLPAQINMAHFIEGEKRQSGKVSNPEKKLVFNAVQ